MPSKPRPVVEVPAKTCKARRSVEPREYRDRAAHMRVEVTLWALPIGTQKAVNTIGRNRNGLDGNGADGHFDFAQRREGRAIYLEYFGKVVLHQPKPRVLCVVREDDDALARDTAQLCQPLAAARPMMNRKHCKRCVE